MALMFVAWGIAGRWCLQQGWKNGDWDRLAGREGTDSATDWVMGHSWVLTPIRLTLNPGHSLSPLPTDVPKLVPLVSKGPWTSVS